jgi:hypothetical protein
MPTLINQTFFVGDIVIPNLQAQSELERITLFINKYEPDCLVKILGYPLYKLFGSESSQRMTDLLSGAEYTDGNGDTQKWNGLVHDSVLSLIASYIYFYYQENQKAQTSGAGTVIQKPEAGTAYSPADKMAKAWNFFSKEVLSMTSFLWLKKDLSGVRVYPEFSFHQFCETRRISRPIDSVFQF